MPQEKSKKGQVPTNPKLRKMQQDEKNAPTHIAIPIPVAEAIMGFLRKGVWDDTNHLIVALQQNGKAIRLEEQAPTAEGNENSGPNQE